MPEPAHSKWIHRISAATRFLGWLLVIFSLLLHILIVLCFTDNRDFLSAAAVFPIWMWAFCGIVCAGAAILLLRNRLPFIIIALWVVTAVIGADERASLMRGLVPDLSEDRIRIKNGKRVIRVASINCKKRNINAVMEVARFDPDIIFLQEAPPHGALLELANKMFGKSASVVSSWHCAILARGKLKARGHSSAGGAGALLTLDDNSNIELLSIHLKHATTRWDLWRKSCWQEHCDLHRGRRRQLNALLVKFGNDAEDRPKIFGGDFNAPPSSNLFDSVPGIFTNCFGARGKGLGNTFIDRLPILRIDHIYAGEQFDTLAARAVRSRHSDHRMIICDLILK